MARLWDAHDALGDLAQFVEGRSFHDYTADTMLRAAAERKLEVAGEALNQLRALDPELASRVPRIREIVAFRNILAHGYATLDNEQVWRLATVQAPELRVSLAAMLEADQ